MIDTALPLKEITRKNISFVCLDGVSQSQLSPSRKPLQERNLNEIFKSFNLPSSFFIRLIKLDLRFSRS